MTNTEARSIRITTSTTMMIMQVQDILKDPDLSDELKQEYDWAVMHLTQAAKVASQGIEIVECECEGM